MGGGERPGSEPRPGPGVAWAPPDPPAMPATPDALRDAADALARRVLAALPADRAHGRASLGALPGPLAGLVRAELDEAVERAAPVSRWLDPADDPLRAAADAWRDAADAAVAVPAADWEAVVQRAARRALLHLVDPSQALAEAAFEGASGPVPVEAALSRIRAFGPYPYLPEIAARYAERKGVDRIDRPGLQTLLQRIDRRMVGAFGPDDWVTLLGPLFDLAGPVSDPPGSVPAALLRPLLQAKGADALAGAFGDAEAVDLATVRHRVAEAMGGETPQAEREEAARPGDVDDEQGGGEPRLGARSSNADNSDADGPDADGPDADGEPEVQQTGLSSDSPAGSSAPPVVIGSRYGTPEFDGVDESGVLGPPRPATEAAPPEADATEAPMDRVRDALVETVPPGPALAQPEPEAPPVPTLDPAGSLSPDPAPLGPPPDAPDAPPPPAQLTPAQTELGMPGPPAVPEAADQTSPADSEEPLWKRLAREHGTAPTPSPSPTGASPPGAARPDDDEPLWKRFATSDLAARLPPPPRSLADEFVADDAAVDALPEPNEAPHEGPELDALERRVLGEGGRERRAWYVADLFAGSPGAYHQTLAQIDRAPTYTDATGVVSAEVFRRHRVDPYTDAAVAFIDAVQAQFERRRG